jgi:hypothetical protein
VIIRERRNQGFAIDQHRGGPRRQSAAGCERDIEPAFFEGDRQIPFVHLRNRQQDFGAGISPNRQKMAQWLCDRRHLHPKAEVADRPDPILLSSKFARSRNFMAKGGRGPPPDPQLKLFRERMTSDPRLR